MKWIEKCPHCGHTAHIQINVRNSYVSVELLCDACDAIFKCKEYLDEEFMRDKTIPEVVNECLTDVLARWNKRAKEPQEKKETRFERLLKKERQADRIVCCLAYEDKYKGKSCRSLICSECEFYNAKNAIDYLLAPYEKGNK